MLGFSFCSEGCHNRIDCLKGSRGNVLEDQSEIFDVITGFYKSLLGSCTDSLVGIDIQAMRDGPQLTQAQAFDLIQPIFFL